MDTPSTPWMLAVRHGCFFTSFYNHLHTQESWMRAIALLHSLLRPCKHPVRHVYLLYAHYTRPICLCTHHVRHVWLMWLSSTPSRTMHTPGTSWMLAVALLHSPLRPCTHSVRYVCLLYADYTRPRGHLHIPYAMYG